MKNEVSVCLYEKGVDGAVPFRTADDPWDAVYFVWYYESGGGQINAVAFSGDGRFPCGERYNGNFRYRERNGLLGAVFQEYSHRVDCVYSAPEQYFHQGISDGYIGAGFNKGD